MWLEAILSRQDLEHVIRDLTPTKIELSHGGELFLGPPSSVTLVAGLGLRVVSRAKLRWTVLGLHVPVTIESVTVLLEPQVRRVVGKGDALAFKIQLEALSVTAIPDILEGTVVERVNAELAHRHAELVWDFSETLSHRFQLPNMLQPARNLDLQVAWGEARIGDDALVFAISVHVRGTVAAPVPSSALALPTTRTAARRVPALSAMSFALLASVTAFSISALGFAIGSLVARRRNRSLVGLGLLRA
jgi:hypothetical protein